MTLFPQRLVKHISESAVSCCFCLESPSWYNSVSSVLSSNDRIFASGVAIKGSPGWWALHHWEPPIPPRKLTLKRSFSKAASTAVAEDDEEIIISSGEEELENKLLNITESSQSEAEYEDLIVDESSDEAKVEDTESATLGTSTSQAPPQQQQEPHESQEPQELEQEQVSDKIDPLQPVVPSADLKQQLLERLLMMDSSLLQDAIKKAKAKKMAEIEGQAKKKAKADAAEAKAAAIAIEETIQAPTLPKECLDALEPFLTALNAHFSLTPVIRASPYENDLLKKCNKVNYNENPVVARLRRKLLVRRQRRRVNLGLFDIDQWMYLFLKSTEKPLEPISKEPANTTATDDSKIIDKVEFPLTFDPQSIPFIADPSKSLYVKLTGMAALYGTCPYPVTSPFTGKILPEYISEESNNFDIPKLNFLNELKTPIEDDDKDLDFSSLIKPSTIKTRKSTQIGNLTIKYTNLRKEFVGQLNDLLSDSFWPGIDVSEALEYPDYAVIALVGLSVVGCAIFNPDGYLSYLYVRPDFQGHNLSAKMLSILIPVLSPRKDLTLHVSVSNTPAMLLYQRIGFKPEEFIVNFYDNYIGVGSDENINSTIGNKNAFFMRLRR